MYFERATPALQQNHQQTGGAQEASNLDLAALVRAWPGLPAPMRAGILAMVRAAEKEV